MLKVKLPFEPSIPAQEAAITALDDFQYLDESLHVNSSGMSKIVGVLDSYDFKYIPSVTNFITVIFEEANEAQRFSQKMLKHGVILRHLIGFGLLSV